MFYCGFSYFVVMLFIGLLLLFSLVVGWLLVLGVLFVWLLFVDCWFLVFCRLDVIGVMLLLC